MEEKMKLLSFVTIIALCLTSAAGSALAERQVTATKLAQDVQTYNAGKDAAADCIMGNLNAPAFAIGDWVWGAESYYYIFNADQAGCTCTGGFTVDAVHMYLQFAEDDVPVTFEAFVGFGEAAPGAVEGCMVPGPEICSSPIYTVTIDAAGFYDIALPMTPGACECAYFGYNYEISFNFMTTFTNLPDLITDASPLGCVSYNDYGAGMLDLQDFGMPGETSMYADIICCESPVSTESKSMGDLKALFR